MVSYLEGGGGGGGRGECEGVLEGMFEGCVICGAALLRGVHGMAAAVVHVLRCMCQ